MTALIAWGEATLFASTLLMVLVLAVRAPVRRWVGPQLSYALWVLPALRMILPALPANLLEGLPVAGATSAGMAVLFTGPAAVMETLPEPSWPFMDALVAIWLAGAISLLGVSAIRHFVFCRRLCAKGGDFGRVGNINVIASDVEGPLAFGTFHRFIAVPRTFTEEYDAVERDLALAHERAHHARGDLVANWVSLVILAVHWWNPVAWRAIRAFREDQELAADAYVLAGKTPSVLVPYAQVLAKAAGIGALPACNLNARHNLKGRLMMIQQKPRSSRQLVIGGAVLALVGSGALAATVATTGTPDPATARQAVTIGVKPDGAGAYTLIVGDKAVAPGAPLPLGLVLPADFTPSSECDLKPGAKPSAMVIKGTDATQTYTVMCASGAPASMRATLTEGLASLTTMRASVASQGATPLFPETERTHALGAIDRSIREVRGTLAASN